ncbi:hypothetical protein BJ322DRAFT_180765 [Thelephora terrestris]|uniref:F-box domain-containing protein n=1 Tax=Thelephora terrestris TaxID=56493 RepID=A0A9P6HB35_9AGAM|nr:hypothetical protein BJ322DRAFT_180765 [Thelephora terrestris]
MQISDRIARTPAMLKRMEKIKNCLAPKERHLIDATAVCQHWRETLLSFPRLWRHAGGISSEIQAYIERLKSTPLDVSLSNPSVATPYRPRRLLPVGQSRFDHRIGRMVELQVDHYVELLPCPIPTLHISWSPSFALLVRSLLKSREFFLCTFGG